VAGTFPKAEGHNVLLKDTTPHGARRTSWTGHGDISAALGGTDLAGFIDSGSKHSFGSPPMAKRKAFSPHFLLFLN